MYSNRSRVTNEIRKLQSVGFGVTQIIDSTYTLIVSKDTHSFEVRFPSDYPFTEPKIIVKGLQGVTLIGDWNPCITVIDIWNDYVLQIGKSFDSVIEMAKQNKSGFAFIPWENAKEIEEEKLEKEKNKEFQSEVDGEFDGLLELLEKPTFEILENSNHEKL